MSFENIFTESTMASKFDRESFVFNPFLVKDSKKFESK